MLSCQFRLKSLQAAGEMFSGRAAEVEPRRSGPQVGMRQPAARPQMLLKVAFIQSMKVVTSGRSCGFC